MSKFLAGLGGNGGAVLAGGGMCAAMAFGAYISFGIPSDTPADASAPQPVVQSSVEAPQPTAEPPQDAPAVLPQNPTFDELRRETDGTTIIAGRAEPLSEVKILLDGAEVATATADSTGGFAAIAVLPPKEDAQVVSLSAQSGEETTASLDEIILAPRTRAVPKPVEDAPLVADKPAITEQAEAPAPVEDTVEQAEAPAPAEDTTAQAEAPAPAEETVEQAEAPAPAEETVEQAEAPAPAEDTTEQAEAPAPAEDTTEQAEAPAPVEDTVEQAEAPAPVEDTVEQAEAPAPAEDTVEQAEAPAPDEDTIAQAEAPAPAEDTTAQAEAPAPVGDTVEQAEAPAQIAVLKSDADGVRLLQSAKPEAMTAVALDTIGYSDLGDVQLTGRAQTAASKVRVYLDNRSVITLPVGSDGRWQGDLPNVDEGVYTLRVDEVSAEGTVSSRVETPFKRESTEVLAAATASQDGPVKSITVQAGATLWAIARDRYGDGTLFVRVFEANSGSIRDPNLIYPGQVFDLPN